MSYAIDITPEAAEDLARLPLPVAQWLEGQLHRLAEHPAQYSFPSHFPYPIDGQAFKCDYEWEEVHYFFHVLFRYGQDEQTLHILLIGIQRI